jgi:2,3-dihydroxybiphenyl 1,2-dioxygenase
MNDSTCPAKPRLALAYLVFEVSSPRAWQSFCGDVLGLPAPSSNVDGSLGWPLDDAAQRIVVRSGPRDDVAALGFECADDGALDALLERLQRGGEAVAEADEALRRARRMRRLHVLDDPDGNRIELGTGLERGERGFSSAAFPHGFCIGDLGLGHAVLVSRDVERLAGFYVERLGFGVTERLDTRVGPIAVKGVFLHCNRRHHSLAIFAMPSAKRMHHFMLQAPDIADIGLAYERARRHKVPMSLELGQHPAPEDTFSFYGSTPSGFDFELGANSREIDPAHWHVQQTVATSSWGHRPTLRLKMRIAGALLRRSFAGERPRV